MHLFDPKRPLYDNYWPRLINPETNQTLGMFQHPEIVKIEKIDQEIWIILRLAINVGGGNHRYYEKRIKKDELGDLIDKWINDVEGTLSKEFKVLWDWKEAEKLNSGFREKVKETPKGLDLGDLL